MRTGRRAQEEFTRTLVSNEEIVWSGRPPLHATVTSAFRLSPGAVLLLFCLWFGALLVVVQEKGPAAREVVLQGVPILFLLWALVGIVLAFARSRGIRYAVTSERVWISRGLLWKSERTYDLDKIVSVSVRRSPLQNLLGLASIELNLSADTVLSRPSFPSPYVLYDVPEEGNVERLLMDTWMSRDNAERKTPD